MLTIYHNPRCSKSREALTLAQQFATQNALELHIVDYQKTPLSRDQLATLVDALNTLEPSSVRDMLRTNEDAYAALKLENASDDACLDALAAHPILLQRPIVQLDKQAVIARPPERALKVLKV